MAIELITPDGLPKPDAYVQVAVATGESLSTVKRRWRVARLWLLQALSLD